MLITSALQDFSISELEGEIYDARKRKFNDSDEENNEFDEKPLKKKSKQKKEKPSIEKEVPAKKSAKKLAQEKQNVKATGDVGEKPSKKKAKKQKLEVNDAPGKYVLLKKIPPEENGDENLMLEEIFQVSSIRLIMLYFACNLIPFVELGSIRV